MRKFSQLPPRNQKELTTIEEDTFNRVRLYLRKNDLNSEALIPFEQELKSVFSKLKQRLDK